MINFQTSVRKPAKLCHTKPGVLNLFHTTAHSARLQIYMAHKKVTTDYQISNFFSVYGWLHWRDHYICIKPEKKSVKFSDTLDTGVCLQAFYIMVPLEIKCT